MERVINAVKPQMSDLEVQRAVLMLCMHVGGGYNYARLRYDFTVSDTECADLLEKAYTWIQELAPINVSKSSSNM